MLSSSHPVQTEHQRVAKQYLVTSLAALHNVYSIIYKNRGSHSKDVIEPTLEALIDICCHKFDKMKNKSGFFLHHINSLSQYIEYINSSPKTHHHARMLFQILITFNRLSFKKDIMPTERADFLEELNKCPEIAAGNPPVAIEEYQQFMQLLADLKNFVATDTLNKIQLAIQHKQPISDEVASALFYAALGAGDSEGKKFADSFMEHIVPTMPFDKLSELTAGVMRAQSKSQATDATIGFFRATGVITDRLYAECAFKCAYDPRRKPSEKDSPEQRAYFEAMVRLNKELFIGKGYDFDNPSLRSESAQTASAQNAIVELDFKIGKIDTDYKKILEEILESNRKHRNTRLPPPIPLKYRTA